MSSACNLFHFICLLIVSNSAHDSRCYGCLGSFVHSCLELLSKLVQTPVARPLMQNEQFIEVYWASGEQFNGVHRENVTIYWWGFFFWRGVLFFWIKRVLCNSGLTAFGQVPRARCIDTCAATDVWVGKRRCQIYGDGTFSFATQTGFGLRGMYRLRRLGCAFFWLLAKCFARFISLSAHSVTYLLKLSKEALKRLIFLEICANWMMRCGKNDCDWPLSTFSAQFGLVRMSPR